MVRPQLIELIQRPPYLLVEAATIQSSKAALGFQQHWTQ
jgi:hypothetical protein